MPELRLKLDPQLFELVRGLCLQASANLKANLPPTEDLAEDDETLAEAWLADLRDGQSREAAALLQLLGKPGFGSRPLALDETAAEEILRACADIRLRIRHDWLRDLPDEALERGDLTLGRLAPPQREGALAYIVLAAIQEDLIAGLDPET